MNSIATTMPKGTFERELAKLVFGDDVTRQRGPLSDAEQKACSDKLLKWFSETPMVVIAKHAHAIDRQWISKLHGAHLRVVVQWFAENAPSVTSQMPKVTRYTEAMVRAVGYNALYQPGPLMRFRLALEMDNQAGSTAAKGAEA
jgi:hypothetical protein